jgi:predicted lipoprotein with Yx(FWY)xxD motif
MRGIALAPLVAAVALAIGCGGDEANGNEEAVKPDPAIASDAVMTRTGRVVKVVGSDYGPVIADGKGEALYLFGKEKSKKSQCYGECARVWPPVLTKGKPRAGQGARANLLGTTRRRNGRLQVTYAGQPLYYYVDDSPGTILCHDVAEFGGLWLVVKPNGKPAG